MQTQDSIKKIINNNIVSTQEAANILGVSQHTISRYVRDNKLTPLKKISSTYIFYKYDIENFYENNKISEKKVILFSDKPANKVLKLFMENIYKLDEIVEISAYFHRIDAINDGSYLTAKTFFWQNIENINSIRFLIKDKLGNIFTSDSLLPGYNGHGPNCFATLLNYLNEKKLIKINPALIMKIYDYKVIKFLKNNNSWSTETHTNLLSDSIWEFKDIKIDFYLHTDNLILLLKPNNNFQSNIFEIFSLIEKFIKFPDEIIIYPDERTAEGFNFSLNEDTAINIRIIDSKNKREVWIPFFSTSYILLGNNKETTLKEIINLFGYNEPNKFAKFKDWINKKLLIKNPVPISLKK